MTHSHITHRPASHHDSKAQCRAGMVHYTKCLQINDLEHTFAFVLFIKFTIYTIRATQLLTHAREAGALKFCFHVFVYRVTDVGCKYCKELYTESELPVRLYLF